MVKGATKSGFEFEIDEKLMEDQELLDLIVDSESEDDSIKVKATRKLYTFILGDKGYERLKAHVREKNDGYCPVKEVTAEFLEIFNSVKELKNS